MKYIICLLWIERISYIYIMKKLKRNRQLINKNKTLL
nr:MAG TPA: hypothetical protein [Caudoviricetes sp.]